MTQAFIKKDRGIQVKIIAYCQECHKEFDKWPKGYGDLYRKMVEDLIDYGRTTFFANNFCSQQADKFLQTLEKAGFLVSTECGLWKIQAEPSGINIIEFDDRQDIEYYHVCKEFQKHEPVYVDEYLEEE